MSSTCSQGSAGSASDSKEPECEPSPSAKSSLSVERLSPKTFQASPATTTCEPSPPTACEQMELFPMSSAEGSPARTSVRLANKRALMANAVDYGRSTPELLAK